MNFNITGTVDYQLQHSMTDELIKLYGVLCKLLIVEKINKDDLVFGDYSHIKTDSESIYTVYGLPETTETWDNIGINYTDFGLLTQESINLYFSRDSLDAIFTDFSVGNGFKDIIGNLIVLPSNRIIEITDIEFEVPGISNLFTDEDRKNVYKLVCKTYDNRLTDETTPADISSPVSEEDYETLDTYFAELIDNKESVDTEAETTEDVQTEKPVVNTDEDSVFGRF